MLLFLVVFCLIVNLTVLVYSLASMFQKFLSRDTQPINENEISVVEQEDPKVKNSIINILVLGLDAREENYEDNADGVRSDSVLILTLDLINNKIKLSSLMRDMYVRVPGSPFSSGYDKLTHAFAYGAYNGYEKTGTSSGAYRTGAIYSLKAVNENFDLNIKDFVIFNFYSFKDVIDEMGGVTINLTQDEIDILSGGGYDVVARPGEEGFVPLKNAKPGMVSLNGYQALSYARIRSIGDDVARTQRQRNVMQAMYAKLKKVNVFQLPSVLTTLLDSVNTSLDNREIINITKEILTRNLPIDTMNFPVNYDDTEIYGVNYVTFDEDTTKTQVHDFIFRDIKPDAQNDTD